jgi:hypothetical protein
MKNALYRSLVLALGVSLVATAAFAKNGKKDLSEYNFETISTVTSDYQSELNALAASAAQGTTELYTQSFDVGANCSQASWTVIDLAAVSQIYFHVDDYALLPAADFSPIQDDQSLWCGTRTSGVIPVCTYLTAPGYGNNWDQTWSTKTCIAVSADSLLDVAFLARWDVQGGYDGTSLEYTADCPAGVNDWEKLDGGITVWTGNTNVPDTLGGVNEIVQIAESYPVVPSAGGQVRVRLRFVSDLGYSDEDGITPTNGALHVDSLKVEGLATEDFEGEALNATQSNDWIAGVVSAYGAYMALFPGSAMVQQDPCARDLGCLWSAINGSTETYACGGFPAQKAIPKGNADGAYLYNEIWSPQIPIIGSGAVLNMAFSIYRDMQLDNLTFYLWRVRTYVGALSCPTNWLDQSFVYYGGQKDWIRQTAPMGPLVNLATGTHIQVGLGVIDQCRTWCGVYGTGACHSHAPLIDTIRIYRVASLGPQWTIRDLEQFNDNFAEISGDWAGFTRADAGNNIRSAAVPGIDPGDSCIVTVADPVSGLANDGLGGKKVYIYVATWPQNQAGKSGAAVAGRSETTGETYVYAGSTVANGITWDCVRLNATATPNVFRIDLNDCLWEPCDTVCFFYCAENTGGVKTYASGSALTLRTTDINVAAVNASEFTCLPAGGWKHGGDVIYVDGMDGRGSQPYFDTAFQSLGMLDEVDRYDVRGPSSAVGNRLSSRVKHITQLTDCYKKIIWGTGDLTVSLGQGITPPEKSPDYALLNLFLGSLTDGGGVYLSGDDIPQVLDGFTAPQAVTFKTTYITYTLTSANHVTSYGISPVGNGIAGGCFDGDTFIIYGGCFLINDFDVMDPTLLSQMEVSYGTPGATNGAVISKQTDNGTSTVGVILSGFGFEYIRDDDNDGIADRFDHMHDVLVWLDNTPPQPTGTSPVAKNSLSQNYPNPFNPQTTIAFSVKDRGLVSLKVYNVAGQLVRTLANEEFAVGPHTKVWDGRNDAGQTVSSGVYFYKLVANNFSQTKKMVLLK